MNISEEKYERLMLTIFFEMLTIILFIVFYEKALDVKGGLLIFFEAILVFQLPFIAFIRNDLLGRRPSLSEKIIKWAINILIGAIIAGLAVLALWIEWRSTLAGSIILAITGIWRKRQKISTFLGKS